MQVHRTITTQINLCWLVFSIMIGCTLLKNVHRVQMLCYNSLYNLFLVLRQLEQQESQNKNEMDELLLRLSSLQEENRSLALDKANLSADLKRMEAELELKQQANRY